MTTSTFAMSHASPVQVYFHNLGQASRLLGAALIRGAQLSDPKTVAAVMATPKVDYDKPAHRAEAADMLNALASQFDATQPNQAAELRWLASRG